MLTPMEQFKILIKTFYTIKNGRLVEYVQHDNNMSFDVAVKLVNFSKYESWTNANFRIVAMYIALKKRTENIPVIENFMNYLRAMYLLTDDEITGAMKFKSLIVSYKFQLKNDINNIEAYNISTNELYNKKLISFFGFYWYYNRNQNEMNNIIIKAKFKEILGIMNLLNKKIKSFVENFDIVVNDGKDE